MFVIQVIQHFLFWYNKLRTLLNTVLLEFPPLVTKPEATIGYMLNFSLPKNTNILFFRLISNNAYLKK